MNDWERYLLVSMDRCLARVFACPDGEIGGPHSTSPIAYDVGTYEIQYVANQGQLGSTFYVQYQVAFIKFRV